MRTHLGSRSVLVLVITMLAMTAATASAEPGGGEASLPPALAVPGVAGADLTRIVLPASEILPSGAITTVAGGGAADGGPAAEAHVYQPMGVVVGPDGALYIAEGPMHRIRRVDLDTGIITTVAGTGERGAAGDGGSARAAQFSFPAGLAFDGEGNLYVADVTNDRIRKIDTDGIITTFAGGGFCSGSTFFLGGPYRGFPTGKYCGDGGPATEAELFRPYDVVVGEDGSLYIADSWNNRVRRVAPDGIITTVAGNGEQGFAGDNGPATSANVSSPDGVALDSQGNLYIADTLTGRVRKVSPDGTITTVAGGGSGGIGDGGPATSARISFPAHIAVDAAGNLLIVDHGNHRIRKVDAETRIISTIAGSGQVGYGGDGGPADGPEAKLRSPYGIAVAPQDGSALAGAIFIGDTFNHRVRRIDGEGTLSTFAGNGSCCYSGDGGAATNAGMDAPSAVAVGGDGDLYVADWIDHRVRRVSEGTITTFAGTGTAGFSGDGGPASSAEIRGPQGLAVDPTGNVFISDTGNHRVRRIDAETGEIATVAGTGSRGFSGDGGPATAAQLSLPYGLAFDAEGNLFIADSDNSRVRRVDAATGVITTVAGNGILAYTGDGVPATRTGMYPADVAVDAEGNLYVADWINSRIRKVESQTGQSLVTTVAGSGAKGYAGDGLPAPAASLNLPRSVDVDADGNLYIADFANMRVRKVSTSGFITTLAGDGYVQQSVADIVPLPPVTTTCNLGPRCTGRHAGDGGPATEASLNLPVGVAVDHAGNVYIADEGNRRVRSVVAAPTTPAGAYG